MSYIDVTGKTEEEAIQNALAQLGMDRDDVSVEILERAKSGFLGMGAKPARVRVTYGPDEAPMEEVAVPVKPAVVEKPEKKEEPKPQPKPQQPRQPKPQQQPRQPRQPKPQQPRREERVERVEKPIAVPAVDLPECTDDNAVRITAFLTGLLEHMDSPAAVKVYEEEKGRYKVILEGQKLGALIGRRGETLDAIQQLTNYAVNSGNEKRIRVHVDAENYRARREASLESLAMKVAAKVKKYRRSVTLEAMNAYERHVIHAALQDVKGVTTYSVGTEPNRRVVVAYDRGENN